MVLRGSQLLRFSGDQFVRFGANYRPFTTNGQLWRLISAMFVHIGLTHLLMNMWCLYELGAITEPHLQPVFDAPYSKFYGLTGVSRGNEKLYSTSILLRELV